MDSIFEYWPVTLLITVGLFFALRWVNLWYWKINDFKEAQEEQIRLLKKIAGEKEIEKDVPVKETKPEKTYW